MALVGVAGQLPLEIPQKPVRHCLGLIALGLLPQILLETASRLERKAAKNAIDSCLHDITPSSYGKPVPPGKVPVSRAGGS